MRKLYHEFFYIPKHGKIREKVMLARVSMTIAIMVVCLAAMSITAYAYFSYNVTSGSNTIKAANFEADVSITITDSNADPVIVTKDGKVQTATLDAGPYTVLLTKGTSTAKTGFCIITIGDTDYYTQQIGVDVGRNLTDGSASVKFTLIVSSATKIEILSHWGTSSCYGYEEASNNPIYIESGDEIDLSASTFGNDETPSTEGQGTTESTTTTEPSTTPVTTPSTETTQPSGTTGASEPTDTTEQSTSTTDPATTQPTEPSATETPGTSESDASTAESASNETTDAQVTTETQTVTENSETTGNPTTETSEA